MVTTPRVQNYFWHRERPETDVEWIRADAALNMEFPRPLVVVSGLFELLHSGVMRMIFAAREKAGKGGTLLATMASDRLIKEALGEGRPLMSWPERSAQLGYMPIDQLVEYDTRDELVGFMKALKPDLIVSNPVPGVLLEPFLGWSRMRKLLIRSSGMTTDEIIRRCKETTGNV